MAVSDSVFRFVKLFLVIMVILVFGTDGYTKAHQPEKTSNSVAVATKQLNIHKGRKRKFVVTVTNNSAKVFKGTVRVVCRGAGDEIIDSDTVDLRGGLGPYGARKSFIFWFRRARDIIRVDHNIMGSLEASE